MLCAATIDVSSRESLDEVTEHAAKEVRGRVIVVGPGGRLVADSAGEDRLGADYGSPVSPNYKSKDPHFPYTGELDKVTITLTGDDSDRAKEVDESAQLD